MMLFNSHGHIAHKVTRRVLALAAGLFYAVSFAVHAQQPEEPEIKPGAPPPIRELGGGIFELGKIRIDKNTKSATFAASVNMNSGTVEYLLVRAGGKTHESALVTDAQPYYLHVAMLLLGAKGSGKKKGEAAAAPNAINSAYLQSAPELTGDAVSISVSWKSDGVERRAKAEEFLAAVKEGASTRSGRWLYTGSLLTNGRFLAQDELSIVALVIDPAALINNHRPGNRDDTAWEIDEKKIPPVGTPVEITIKLEEPPKR